MRLRKRGEKAGDVEARERLVGGVEPRRSFAAAAGKGRGGPGFEEKCGPPCGGEAVGEDEAGGTWGG
jgi:hypothetical protein